MTSEEDSVLRNKRESRFMNLIVVPNTKCSEDNIFSDWLKQNSIRCGDSLVEHIVSTAHKRGLPALYVDSEIFSDSPIDTVQTGQESYEYSFVKTGNAENFRKQLERLYTSSRNYTENASQNLKRSISSLGIKVSRPIISKNSGRDMTCPLCESTIPVDSFESHVGSCMQDIGSDFSDYGGPSFFNNGDGKFRDADIKTGKFFGDSINFNSEKPSYINSNDIVNLNIRHGSQNGLPVEDATDVPVYSFAETGSDGAKNLVTEGHIIQCTQDISVLSGNSMDSDAKKDSDALSVGLESHSPPVIRTKRKLRPTIVSSSSNQYSDASSEIIIDYDEADFDCVRDYPGDSILGPNVPNDSYYPGGYDDEQVEYNRKELESLSPLKDFINIKELYEASKPKVPENIRMYFDQFSSYASEGSARPLEGMIENLNNKEKVRRSEKRSFRGGWKRFNAQKNAKFRISRTSRN